MMVTLISGFFPLAKPSSSSSMESFPWMDMFGPATCCDPRILALFNKLSALLKEVEKFQKAADEKKVSTSLLCWADICCLGDMVDFHKAPKVNKSFAGLLDKSILSSRYVALSRRHL